MESQELQTLLPRLVEDELHDAKVFLLKLGMSKENYSQLQCLICGFEFQGGDNGLYLQKQKCTAAVCRPYVDSDCRPLQPEAHINANQCRCKDDFPQTLNISIQAENCIQSCKPSDNNKPENINEERSSDLCSHSPANLSVVSNPSWTSTDDFNTTEIMSCATNCTFPATSRSDRPQCLYGDCRNCSNCQTVETPVNRNHLTDSGIGFDESFASKCFKTRHRHSIHGDSGCNEQDKRTIDDNADDNRLTPANNPTVHLLKNESNLVTSCNSGRRPSGLRTTSDTLC